VKHTFLVPKIIFCSKIVDEHQTIFRVGTKNSVGWVRGNKQLFTPYRLIVSRTKGLQLGLTENSYSYSDFCTYIKQSLRTSLQIHVFQLFKV